MNKLYWHTCGEGDRDLVLLHGWGLNAEVWRCILPRLSTQFRVHLVDLPGYGRSQGFGALTLEQMSDIVMQQAPDNAVWLGWSMGGLVASDIALRYPERVAALVTVSSSPCFTAQGEWPGIKSEVLSGFQRQLSEDFKRTVERFLALQTLGTESARQDARILKDVVLTQPMPSVEVLNGGLDILRSVDLREQMAGLKMPLLRIYGYLDGLVPRKVAGLLDESCPNSESVVIQKSAHAPFVSHPGEFCGVVESWVQEVGKV